MYSRNGNTKQKEKKTKQSKIQELRPSKTNQNEGQDQFQKNLAELRRLQMQNSQLQRKYANLEIQIEQKQIMTALFKQKIQSEQLLLTQSMLMHVLEQENQTESESYSSVDNDLLAYQNYPQNFVWDAGDPYVQEDLNRRQQDEYRDFDEYIDSLYGGFYLQRPYDVPARAQNTQVKQEEDSQSEQRPHGQGTDSDTILSSSETFCLTTFSSSSVQETIQTSLTSYPQSSASGDILQWICPHCARIRDLGLKEDSQSQEKSSAISISQCSHISSNVTVDIYVQNQNKDKDENEEEGQQEQTVKKNVFKKNKKK